MDLIDKSTQFRDGIDFLAGKVILIDKELSWTSFDVVNKIRFRLKHYHAVKKIKVGHNGTLDPLASGLVMVFTGKYTKLIAREENHDKSYIATVKLGVTTDSLDRETEEKNHTPFDHVTLENLQKRLAEFIGEQEQIIPVYSASKHKGRRMYSLAREGNMDIHKTKPVIYHEIKLLDFDPPFIKVNVKCGRGTYIRAFARDLGVKLGTSAYLYALRRTQIGEYCVENALSVDAFCQKIESIEYSR